MSKTKNEIVITELKTEWGKAEFTKADIQAAQPDILPATMNNIIYMLKKFSFLKEVRRSGKTMIYVCTDKLLLTTTNKIIASLNSEIAANRVSRRNKQKKSASKSVPPAENRKLTSAEFGNVLFAAWSADKAKLASLEEKCHDYDQMVKENFELKERNSKLCIEVNKIKINSPSISIKELLNGR